MVDVTPQMAFIAALQGQFNASRQGGGGPVPGIPGLSGAGGNDPANTPGGLSGGITAGGVPSTATTGTSVANTLISGGGGSDALSQQVGNALIGREAGERGDLGAGITGGDLGALLSILSGPGAFATILGSLVASDAAGLPLDPSLLTPASLAGLAREEGSQGIGSQGIAFADRDTGRSSFNTDTGNVLTSPGTNNVGAAGIRFSDRDRFGPSSPGRGLSRGTGRSNAGR